MDVVTRVVRAPLRRPFGAAWGETRARELVVLELRDVDGVTGWGEAAPLEGYDGVSVAQVLTALRDCDPVLRAAGADVAHPAVLAACAERTVVPQALAAVDLALWDLAGRRARLPLWELLSDRAGAASVRVNATIGALDRAGAASAAAAARAAGFACLKLKVGTGDDAGRVAAVRAAAGPNMALRLDANGVWSVPEARAALRVLAPAGLELCEEPVSGAAAVEELARTLETPVALAIDETTAEPAALDRRVCAAACLKLARLGGVSGVRAAAQRAARSGYEVYLASTFDGPLGIAAALHTAIALGVTRPCGLATLDLFTHGCDALTVDQGALAPPPGAGLGEGLRDWYGRSGRE